jgi:hypothetical protein
MYGVCLCGLVLPRLVASRTRFSAAMNPARWGKPWRRQALGSHSLADEASGSCVPKDSIYWTRNSKEDNLTGIGSSECKSLRPPFNSVAS